MLKLKGWGLLSIMRLNFCLIQSLISSSGFGSAPQVVPAIRLAISLTSTTDLKEEDTERLYTLAAVLFIRPAILDSGIVDY